MKKRLTSVLLTAAMVFSLCGPIGGLVPEAGALEADGFSYEIVDGAARIYGTDLTGDIVFPSEIGGYPVKSIGSYGGNRGLFGESDQITSVTIPETVEVIEDYTFYDFNNLKRVVLSTGLTTIEHNAFEKCYALEQITIPNTVKTIGDDAFSGTGLTSINLPNSVTDLGSSVFSGSDLQNVTLPSNLKEIPSFMFYCCSNLESIRIPDSVQRIGNYAFDASGLRSVTIPSSVREVGENAFANCDDLESVSFSGSGTELSEAVFNGCKKLSSVTLPTGMTAIPDYLFRQCENLSSISLPANVTKIGKFAFKDCLGLTQVSLPDGVQTIGAWAFDNCEKLERVFIPASVTDLYVVSFIECPLLTDIYYGGTEDEWDTLTETIDNSPELQQSTVHYNSKGFETESPAVTPEEPAETGVIPTPVWEEARYTADGVVKLEWTIPLSTVNHDNLMDGVKILRKSGNGGFSVVGTEMGDVTFGYTDTNVQYGQTYTYALQGFYQGQDGAVSEERVVVCLGLEDRYDIPVPELGIIRNDPNGIRIEWELPEDLPAGIEEVSAGFHILRKTEGGEYTRIYTSNDPESNAYLDRTASNGETYTYTVQMFVVDHVGGYDETGRTITRKAVDSNYPNDEIGWSVINSMKYFGHENDYKIPKERFDETLGTSLPQQAYNKLKSGLKAGGYCYGLSVLAAAEYEGLIDLSTHFADAAFTDTLADYGMTAIESGQNGSYHAVIKDQDIIGLIERAHVLQYAEEFRDCEVFAGQKDYHGLIEYLEEDSSKPLLVGLSTASSGHAVVTYPNMPPEDLGDGWYKIYLYDPNVPQIGLNSQLYKYGMNGQLESAYSAGQSYLLLNTNETGVYGGIWQYYNPALGQNANMESLYYYPLQSIMFYDLTKLPAHTLDRTGTVQLRNFMVVRAKSPTVRAADAKGNTTTLFSVTPDSSAQGFSFTANDELVKHYSFDGENQDTILLWLEDDCGDITLQGDDIEAMYIVEDTLFDVTATGKAEITIDTANAAMSYHTDEDAEIELTVQRNSHSEQDAVAATISTDLDAGDNTTLTLQEDGMPKISGPEGQRYDVTIEKENSSSGIPNATVEDLMEFFGEERLPSFRDVPSDAYYYDAVQWAVEQGITTGTSATRFSPDEPCTRAQVVTFIWRALGLDELDSRSTDNPFRDVPSGAYYRDAVLWAAENGITTGTDANEFSPDEACTRAQVVTFLWRTDFPPKYYESDQVFRDVHVNDYYWFPVQWALERNITTGTDANEFSPDEACTRAQVVTFLYRDFA